MNKMRLFLRLLALGFSTTGMLTIASAQLVAGIEVGTSAYKSNESTSNQFLNRESGLINGTRFYFGAQRNWKTKGWLAELDYKTGAVDYFGLNSFSVPVASSGHVRLVHLSTTLHLPVAEVDNWGFAVAPRLGYRSQARRVDSNAIVLPLAQDYQEGVMALGIIVHNEFERGFGVRARFEIERSFLPRLKTDYIGIYQAVLSRPSAAWRPLLGVTGWYRINPRHSVTVTARIQNLGNGASAPVTLEPVAAGAALAVNLPGQRIRVNSLNAGYAFHF